MRHDKRRGVLIAALVGGVLTLALAFGRSDSTLAFGGQDVSNDNDAPVLEFEQAGPGVTAPKAKKGRALRQDKPIAELPGAVEPLPMSSHMWVGLPAFPVAQSDAVVLGEVTDRRASLTEDRTGVLSEFSVHLDTVFKDAHGLPAPGGVVEVSRPGGAVRFASGKVQRYTFSKLGYPQQGRLYVLFLKRDEDVDFSILTGYELRNDKVLPLDGGGADPQGELQFAVYKGASQEAFFSELKKAVQAASGGLDQ
jgi:hypothetical protein